MQQIIKNVINQPYDIWTLTIDSYTFIGHIDPIPLEVKYMKNDNEVEIDDMPYMLTKSESNALTDYFTNVIKNQDAIYTHLNNIGVEFDIPSNEN